MSCGETLLVQVGHSMSDQRVFCNDLLRFALNFACLLTFNILTKLQIKVHEHRSQVSVTDSITVHSQFLPLI